MVNIEIILIIDVVISTNNKKCLWFVFRHILLKKKVNRRHYSQKFDSNDLIPMKK